jgi:hypothetical protein
MSSVSNKCDGMFIYIKMENNLTSYEIADKNGLDPQIRSIKDAGLERAQWQ